VPGRSSEGQSHFETRSKGGLRHESPRIRASLLSTAVGRLTKWDGFLQKIVGGMVLDAAKLEISIPSPSSSVLGADLDEHISQ